MSGNFTVTAAEDPDDPVVWRYGKFRPDGQFRECCLTASARDGLVKAFGQEWLDRHLEETVTDLERWAQRGAQ